MRRAVCLALLLAALPAAHAQCKFRRLGAIPAQWVASRLVIDGSVNGTPRRMMVDTGSTETMVSADLVEALKLPLAHARHGLSGIGGRSEASIAHLDELSIGRLQWHRTKAVVAWDASADGSPDVLIGGNVLMQSDVELDGKQILLFSASGCGDDAALAYWGDDVPWVPMEGGVEEDRRPVITVQVNGQPVRALIDTGAPGTLIDAAVARRLGVDPDDERARLGEAGGIGAHTTPLSAAVFDTVAIGPEIVRRPRIAVADLWHGVRQDYQFMSTEHAIDQHPQMLLGADFVRSHHLLFATSQHRLYFSYLGGDVFQARAPSAAASPARGTIPP